MTKTSDGTIFQDKGGQKMEVKLQLNAVKIVFFLSLLCIFREEADEIFRLLLSLGNQQNHLFPVV